MQSKANDVDAYLVEVPEDRLEALTRLRKLCQEVLAGYEESMEYGMPSYKKGKDGEVEVAFASQKNYISFYILRQDVFNQHRELLSGLNLGKGCIRYSKPEKIDFDVVRQLLVGSAQSEGEIC
ncbi:MAG: DUF1801 domain-containing protein [Chloroflexi bacterium]|nr:DUF1801 domain-containing protein [Chloroflexota bacterium]